MRQNETRCVTFHFYQLSDAPSHQLSDRIPVSISCSGSSPFTAHALISYRHNCSLKPLCTIPDMASPFGYENQLLKDEGRLTLLHQNCDMVKIIILVKQLLPSFIELKRFMGRNNRKQ
jgi:hypothetical protein